MNNLKIYFAGSIRGGREDREIYLEIINFLQNYGQVLTEHIADKNITSFGQTNMTDEEIYNKDINWINESDIIIAEVTQVSLGVGYEIGYAENKKPVICLYRKQEGKRLSAMLNGNNKLKIFEYTNLNEVKDFLNNFFIEFKKNLNKV